MALYTTFGKQGGGEGRRRISGTPHALACYEKISHPTTYAQLARESHHFVRLPSSGIQKEANLKGTHTRTTELILQLDTEDKKGFEKVPISIRRIRGTTRGTLSILAPRTAWR